jgi:ribosomal protein S18 acetylase RimI-like enzyme
MRSGVLRVADLAESDLQEVAALHLRAFPDSELGHLGVEAVRRSYLWQFEGPHDLTALGAWDDGQLVGFLFGGVFRGSTMGFVKRERWFLLGRVLRHPGMVVRRASIDRIALAARLLVRRSPALPEAERPEGVPARGFGVLAIAVDPSRQGGGAGRLLMARAEEAARAGGFERMHLTVHPDNDRAVRFYELDGWTRSAGDGGRWNGQMTKPLR